MKFNIVHIVPDLPSYRGLRGYQEVIETLQWGLAALGHEATAQVNLFGSSGTNIVLGAQLLAQSTLDALPPGTIVYNLEQIAGKPSEIPERLRSLAQRLHVWDYSEQNLAVWRQILPQDKVVHVPIAWAPILARISSSTPLDIDVLFYGLPGETRLTIFNNLCFSGLSCVFACGLYGAARDSLIARAKLVLNISHPANMGIFEIVRVSYLLANSKAVVAGVVPSTVIETDLQDAVSFVPLNGIIAACQKLLEDEPARLQLEKRGEQIFRNRDIRAILKRALSATGLNGL